MRTIFNNKGVSLIVLIVIMLGMALIGGGVASIMMSKQKSYPFALNSFKAYEIANAGIECTIAWVQDTSNANKGLLTSVNNLTSIPFGGGTGTFSTVISGTSPNEILTSTGTFNNISRVVTLTNFTTYAIPPPPIGLVPDSPPWKGATPSGSYPVPPWLQGFIDLLGTLFPGLTDKTVFIPVINNTAADMHIYQIDMHIANPPGGLYLASISCSRETSPGVWSNTEVYKSYKIVFLLPQWLDGTCSNNIDGSPGSCPSCGTAPCKSLFPLGVKIPASAPDATLRFNQGSAPYYYTFPAGNSPMAVFTFALLSSPPAGDYTVTFHYTNYSSPGSLYPQPFPSPCPTGASCLPFSNPIFKTSTVTFTID